MAEPASGEASVRAVRWQIPHADRLPWRMLRGATPPRTELSSEGDRALEENLRNCLDADAGSEPEITVTPTG